MIKKEILLNPVVRRMDNISEPPVTEPITMKDLSITEANMHLSMRDKARWVEEHNRTANLYFINPRGEIQQVEPSGGWY